MDPLQDDEDVFFLNETSEGLWDVDRILLLRSTNKPFSSVLLRSFMFGIVKDAQDERTALKLSYAIKYNCDRFPPNNNLNICYSFLFQDFKEFQDDHMDYSILKVIDLLTNLIWPKRKNIMKTRGKASTKELKVQPPAASVVTLDNFYDYIQQNYINNPKLLDLPEFNFDIQKCKEELNAGRKKHEVTLSRLFLGLRTYTHVLEAIFEAMKLQPSSEDYLKVFSKLMNNISLPNDHFWNLCVLFTHCPKEHLFSLAGYLKIIYNILIMYGVKENEDKSKMSAVLSKTLVSYLKSSHNSLNECITIAKHLEPDDLRNKVLLSLEGHKK